MSIPRKKGIHIDRTLDLLEKHIPEEAPVNVI